MSKSKNSEHTAVKNTATKNHASNTPLNFRLKWQNLKADHPYFHKRRLLSETVATFGLGFVAKGVLANRVAIPIHNAKGELVAYAGQLLADLTRNTSKYIFTAGFRKSQEVFNLHRAIHEPSNSPLIIVEDFFDCMKLWQYGVRRVVSLMGNYLSPAQEALIRRYTNSRCQILLMLTEDEEGRKARDAIAARLSKFTFLRIHVFDQEGRRPEQLSAEETFALFN